MRVSEPFGGELGILTLSTRSCRIIQDRWPALREVPGLHISPSLGAQDLFAVAIGGEAVASWHECLASLGLRPGHRGSSPDGWTRLYTCAIQSHGPLDLDRLQPSCFVFAEPLHPRAEGFSVRPTYQRWETDGRFRHLLRDPDAGLRLPDAMLTQLRSAGWQTMAMPVLPLELILSEDGPIDDPAVPLHVVANAVPGQEARAAVILAELLAAHGEDGPAPTVRLVHGAKDLLATPPVRVRPRGYLRQLWRMCNEGSILLGVRSYMIHDPADLPKAVEPGDIRSPDGPWSDVVWPPASVFSIRDRAGGRDWSGAMAEVRMLQAEAQTAYEQTWSVLGFAKLAPEDDAQVRPRALRGGSAPQTFFLASGDEDLDPTSSSPGVLEIVLSSRWLDDPQDRRMAARNELACAFLRKLMTPVQAMLRQPYAGVAPVYQRPVERMIDEIWHSLGEIVGAAFVIGSERQAANREGTEFSLNQWVKKVWWRGSQLDQGHAMRLLGAVFLLDIAQSRTINPAPSLEWLTALDLARDTLTRAGPEGPLNFTPDMLKQLRKSPRERLARHLMLGLAVGSRSFDALGHKRYSQALNLAWLTAVVFLRSLLGIEHSENSRSIGPPTRQLFTEWLRVEDPGFWRVADQALEPRATAAEAPEDLVRHLSDYWNQVAVIETAGGHPIVWQSEGSRVFAVLPEQTPFRAARDFANREAVVRALFKARHAEGKVMVPVQPVARLDHFRRINGKNPDGSPHGYELLTSFRARDRETDGVLHVIDDRNAVPDKEHFFGRILTDYVGVSYDTPVSRYTHTELIRRMALELRCVDAAIACIEDISVHPATGGGPPLSFNLTPGLLAPQNPWAREFAEEFRKTAQLLIEEIDRRSFLPIVEIVEGELDADLLWRTIRDLRDSNPAISLGIAIDDQFGPGADVIRLNETVALAARNHFDPLMVKVDHFVVRAIVRPAHQNEPCLDDVELRDYYIDAFSVMIEMVRLSCRAHPPRFIVFEGLSGWWSRDDDPQRVDNVRHTRMMLEALETRRQDLENKGIVLLVQGQR